MSFFRFIFTLMLVLVGCTNGFPSGQATGSEQGSCKETLQFWESLKKITTTGTGAEVLAAPAWPGKVDINTACFVLSEIAATEKARSNSINQLSTLNVDPELINFKIQLTHVEVEKTSLLQDIINFSKKYNETVNLQIFDFGFLFQLFEPQNNDSEEAISRVIVNSPSLKENDLSALTTSATALKQGIKQSRDDVAKLRHEEASIRSLLAQRYSVEFAPLGSTSLDKTIKAPPYLKEEEIIKNLIGQTIGSLGNAWTFESEKEFTAFKIVAITDRSDGLSDYEIRTHVKGIWSGKERDFHLLFSYGRFYTRWLSLELKSLPLL